MVAYRTDQPQLLLDSATEFPFTFTQGGGLDLMLRTSGADENKNVAVGDERLFVTKKDGKTLAVLYRQIAKPAGNRQTFPSPIGQVSFDDVQDVSAQVQVAQAGSNYEFSVSLSVLGLQAPAGKSFRGDVGMVLSDGVRARARLLAQQVGFDGRRRAQRSKTESGPVGVIQVLSARQPKKLLNKTGIF